MMNKVIVSTSCTILICLLRTLSPFSPCCHGSVQVADEKVKKKEKGNEKESVH